MDNEHIVLLLRRIKQSDDGADFVKYLESLSKDNYTKFVYSTSDMSEFHKGYAFAIDSLINSFAQCTKEQEVDTQNLQLHS